jgi:hypothetical protein
MFGMLVRLVRALNVAKFAVGVKLKISGNSADFQEKYFEEKKNEILHDYYLMFKSAMQKLNDNADKESFANLGTNLDNAIYFKLEYKFSRWIEKGEENLNRNRETCRGSCGDYHYDDGADCNDGEAQKCSFVKVSVINVLVSFNFEKIFFSIVHKSLST